MTGPIIDASAHIFFRNDADLRSYLVEPIRSRGWPAVDVSVAAPLIPRYLEESRLPDGAHPGSDPDQFGREVLDARGVDFAILHPMSGACLLPDWHVGNAIINATNRMQAERWLESGSYANRYRGTIRVNPNDVEGAIREINEWKNHRGMVQIGLPLQTQEPYGRPHFRPLWKAACDAGMPIAVHLEMGLGITHPPTPSGTTRTYAHHASFTPMTYIWQLLNMMAEGIFHEFDDLRMVWADGAADMVTPFMWRMDTFGRPHLEQTPWAPLMPSDYLVGHNFFIHSVMDGPDEGAEYAGRWLEMTGKEEMLLYGSSYPDWQTVEQAELPAGWSPTQRAKVLGGNAASLYGLNQLAQA